MDDNLEKRAMPFLLCLLVSLLFTLAPAQAQHFPAPDPPREERPDLPPDVGQTRRAQTRAADIEWTLHKTPDGQHPNGDEQALMWLMNRARQNPAAEGVWLATSQEHDIADGRTFFFVDLQLLQNEFASYTPKPPAAFDVRLYNAARVHSEDLIAREAQDHNQQFARVDAAGFRFTSARGSVFSFAESALNGHAALNIDWANESGGVQAGRGHRVAILSLDGDYTNVGAAAVPENDAHTQVGPLVITINYAHAQTTQTDHFNRFVVGTVWEDHNTNGRYDPGEGIEGIVVMPDKGQYFAITSAGGGYAIPITTPDTYELTFFGGSVALVSQQVVVGQDSVLLDYLVTPDQAILTGAVSGNGTVTSSPGGISCPATCTAAFARGTVVTLTATPASGSTFASWSSNCPNGVVTMDADKTCTAIFPLAQGGPSVAAKLSVFVTTFYQSVLGRLPSTADVSSWVNYLLANPTIAGGSVLSHTFFDGLEYRMRPVTPWEHVWLLYRTILMREPDGSGFEWVVNLMLERLNTPLPWLIGSQEFRHLVPTFHDQSAVAAAVTRLYQEALRRAPSADELSNTTNYLMATGNMEQLARWILNSVEYLSVPRTLWGYVWVFYRALLGRNPTSDEVASVAGYLATRLAEIEDILINTAEFQVRFRSVFE